MGVFFPPAHCHAMPIILSGQLSPPRAPPPPKIKERILLCIYLSIYYTHCTSDYSLSLNLTLSFSVSIFLPPLFYFQYVRTYRLPKLKSPSHQFYIPLSSKTPSYAPTPFLPSHLFLLSHIFLLSHPSHPSHPYYTHTHTHTHTHTNIYTHIQTSTHTYKKPGLPAFRKTADKKKQKKTMRTLIITIF